MDGNKHNQKIDRKSSTATGSDTAHNAPYHRGIQSGLGFVDCPSDRLRREKSSCVAGHAQEEVSRVATVSVQ
jgi:hypothetical protein